MQARSENASAKRPAAKVDGRRLRSEESRRRIVNAMLQLVEAGTLAPSAEQVAAAAGVGLRSVFRHFRDVDSLYLEIAEIVAPRIRALGERPFQATGWQEQMMELVSRRAAAFEALGPILRASRLHGHYSKAVRACRARLAEGLRSLLLSRLPAELKDAPRVEALDLLLSFEAWSRLRDDQGLSVAAAKATLAAAVAAVLALDRPGHRARTAKA